ncbi:hypothetical protein Tdes44962_MAKER01933 [Teratosphaeria destructans]|uniref:Zinc finger PHD-type domain-containing protein n=1 Tax=Teratosphaeria destructans TaxID=418781 RepID=A0A9W7SWF4_9PEZI|nr:hypothetical protein Tdes44962_MAKER01933 [Teratosphaeria destructans]
MSGTLAGMIEVDRSVHIKQEPLEDEDGHWSPTSWTLQTETNDAIDIKQEPDDEDSEAYFNEHVYSSERIIIKDEPHSKDAPNAFEDAYPSLAGNFEEEEDVYEDGTKESDYLPGGRKEPIEVWDSETGQLPAVTHSLPGLSLALRPAPVADDSIMQHSAMRGVQPHHDGDAEVAADEDESLFMDLVDYSKRALGGRARPPKTACFTFPFASYPFHHLLRCGHTVVAPQIWECGSNCKVGGTGKDLAIGMRFRCPHPKCLAEDRARLRRSTGPLRVLGKHVMTRLCRLSRVEGVNPAADRAKLDQEEEGVLEGMNTMDVSKDDSSSACLPHTQNAAHASGKPACQANQSINANDDIGGRSPSETEEEALNSLKARMNNRLHVENLVATKFSREVARLRVDGAEKLRQGAAPLLNQNLVKKLRPLPGAKSTNVISLGGHQKRGLRKSALLPVPQEKDGDVYPHSYNNQGVRDELAQFNSIPEQDLERMVQAENGIVVTSLTGDPDAPTPEDNDEMEQEQDASSTFEQAETFCICESPSDRFMRPCQGCGAFYHPGCIGKGLFLAETYASENGFAQHAHDEKMHHKQGLAFTCSTCEVKARGRSRHRVARASALRTIQQSGRVEMKERKRNLDEAGVIKEKRDLDEFLGKMEKQLVVDERIERQLKKAKITSYRLKRPNEEGREFGPGTLASMRINTSDEIDQMYTIRAATAETNEIHLVCDGCGESILGVFYRCLSCAAKPNDWGGMDQPDFCDRCVIIDVAHHEENGQLVYEHRLEALHVAALDNLGRKKAPQQPVRDPTDAVMTGTVAENGTRAVSEVQMLEAEDMTTVDKQTERSELYKRPRTASTMSRDEVGRRAQERARKMNSLYHERIVTGEDSARPQKPSTPMKGVRTSNRLAMAKAKQVGNGPSDLMEK